MGQKIVALPDSELRRLERDNHSTPAVRRLAHNEIARRERLGDEADTRRDDESEPS